MADTRRLTTPRIRLALARRRDSEPGTALVLGLVVASLLFVWAIWAILHSPPPGAWSPAPQSAAAANGLHARPQAPATLIGSDQAGSRHRVRLSVKQG
jgi:hypothetical protein